MKNFSFQPIGQINSQYSEKSGVPKQGEIRAKNLSELIIFDEFLEGASDIKCGEHYLILFLFDRSENYELRQHPFGNKELEIKGVFSTRSPYRPNFIGITEVEISKVNGNSFEFFGGDMLNGTPVLDVKPVLKLKL